MVLPCIIKLIKTIIIQSIRIYQIGISPILGHRCRFQKTCSQYSIEAIQKHGILIGIWITLIRILKCHPLSIKKNIDYEKYYSYFNNQDIINMDAQQNFLIIFFLIISFILWQIWNIEHNHNAEINSNTPIQQYSIKNNTSKCHINNKDNHLITIQTDVLLLQINTYGGNIEEAYLTNYLENLHSRKPFHLLNTSKEFLYQIHSGWIYTEPSKKQMWDNTQLLYTTSDKKNIYILPKNKNTLKITLTHQFNNDITYTKSYIFHRNSYSIHVLHNIHNTNTSSIKIKLFGHLIQSITIPKLSEKNNNDHNNFPLYSYRGTAYSTNKLKYQKYSFKNIQNSNLCIQSIGGWIAMLQKYFVTAWLPLTPISNTFYTTCIDNKAIIGFQSNTIQIESGEQKEFQSTLWIGPKIQEDMKKIESNLDLVIDYGWLWFIAQPLFKLLNFIYYYINNWGISIIIITLIIRLIMYPLTKAQYTSMAKIRMLQPKLSLIQKEYKHNKNQYHQKIIELYKSEQVNPLGGCLPILIQMPIFLALYYMLSGSVELRHASFTLWIQDLSAQDPYYVLPILMGISMFFLQKMSPSTITDPTQKKVMTIMLIIFTIFFLWFPSGLVLYYIVSNIITIIQQQIIYHGLEKKGLYKKHNIY